MRRDNAMATSVPSGAELATTGPDEIRRPHLGIVLLAFNRCAMLLDCLASLRRAAYAPMTIVVVDNASTDGTPAAVRQQYPEVMVIENHANLGFAAANNVGINWLLDQSVDSILLLNDDTEVDPPMLTTLMEHLWSDEQIGAVGPLIRYHDQPQTVWCAGGAVDRYGLTNHPGADRPVADQPATERQVDYLSGCALLVRASVIRRVGTLDDRFFAYYEETEWCARMIANGYRLIMVPRATMSHKVRQHDRPASPLYHYLMNRNRLLYLQRTGAGWIPITLALLAILRTAISWSIRPRYRAQRVLVRVLARAVLDFLVGRHGMPPAAIVSQPPAPPVSMVEAAPSGDRSRLITRQSTGHGDAAP